MSTYVSRPVRFLIVEDQVLPRKNFEQLVTNSHGIVAATCRNLAEFQEKKHEIEADIAIIDLELGKERGNRDGWLIADTLRDAERPMPIIICSSYNNFNTWNKMPDYRYISQMSKDPTLDQFLATSYPLILRFYPDAASMFRFHPGGSCPRAINDHASKVFTLKHSGVSYPQCIDPQYINFIISNSPKSMIEIYYQGEILEFSSDLVKVQKEAKYNRLFRINRSVIVNANYVDGIDNNRVFVRKMGGVQEFSLSKNEPYLKEVKELSEYYEQLKSTKGR